ncbi:S53 family peptidase [Paractinoplanes durhamensis]|uniref:Serine protease n=2 Tax=Paractinoplanes durhamensis TaxID=113563 RepID=A0ABQ3YXF1_9ACTN|nr:S53 family peptidase [Actinoplanes durhamensis]GIE02276.1 serine protease [Actinoplanes durhamensis]
MIKSSTVRSRLALVVALGTAAASFLGAGPATAAARPGRHVLNGSQPRWLTRARATGGAPAAAESISFGVLLNLRDSANAEATLAQISDPASASYGKWLTTSDFKTRFAPASTDVDAVRSWLKGQGFALRDTLGGMYVEAAGTTAQINKVFGTTVKDYSYQGKTVHANSTALSLPEDTPSAVLGVVAGVLGLDQGQALKTPGETLPGPDTGFRPGTPCSSYYGEKTATAQPAANGKKQPYVVCGYAPKQYQSAYGVSDLIKKGIDGRGVTVAVTDAFASPTIAQDLSTYNRKHGLPAFGRNQFRQITPGPDGYDMVEDCGGAGWYGEETLDIEAVHSMAPGAKIVYVGGADCNTGLDEAWATTIDNHVADIVTNSWGTGTDKVADLGAEFIAFYQQFSLEAALTGITVDFSSGDAGDETQGGTEPDLKTVDFPADLPFVTGVGGTSVGIDKHGKRVWEHGWQSAYAPLSDDGKSWGESAYSSGGGGGTSILFGQPFYQRGVVPDSISKYFGATRMRTVPDISMPGDPNTGFIVGQTQEFTDGTYYDEYRIGGTSLASPLLAGLQAVQSQKQHHPVGFANPAYYRTAGTAAITDIVAPKKPVLQVRTNFVNSENAADGRQFLLQTVDVQTTTIHSTRGYDAETGVGVPGPAFFR